MNPVIQILLALDASKFAAGATQAEKSVNKLVSGIGSRLGGYLGVGFLAHQAMGIIRYADTVDDMSKKLGIGTDQFQELQYAAQKTGASVESFTSALRTLIKTQQDAITGGAGSEAFKPFATLGLSFTELERLSPDQLLYRVGDAFRNGSQEGRDLDAVITLLGRGAMDLMGALKEGLRDLGKEAHRLGQVMDEGIVAQLGAANDQLERTKQGMTVAFAPVVAFGGTVLTMALAGAAKLIQFQSGLLAGLGPKAAWEIANKLADDIIAPGIDTGPQAGLKRKPKPPPPTLWSRIGDPGAVKSWKAFSLLGEEPKTPLTFGSADALARIGLFRGGYDPGERTRLQQLSELRTINNQLGRMLHSLEGEP